MLTAHAAGDGVFATSQNGEIALVDLKLNKTTRLVKVDDVKDVRVLIDSQSDALTSIQQSHGTALSWASWELSSDMKYMLIKSDHVKVCLTYPLFAS